MAPKRPPSDGGSADESDSFHTYRVSSDERPSAAIVKAVAAMTGRRPAALPPLHGRIDPDAIDRLFGTSADGGSRITGRLRFTYGGCTVVLELGAIRVREVDR